MALAKFLDGTNRIRHRQVQPAVQHVEQQTSLQRSLRPAEPHAAQQTSLRRNPQPVARRVVLLISK